MGKGKGEGNLDNQEASCIPFLGGKKKKREPQYKEGMKELEFSFSFQKKGAQI